MLNLLQAGAKGVDVYGHYLGMAVPNKPGTGLRSLAQTTFGLLAAAAGLTVLSNVLSLALGISGGGIFANPFAGTGATIAVGGLGLIGALCWLAGMVVFILYLRTVAISVKRKDLGKLLRAFLITAVSLVVAGLVLFGIAVVVVGATAFSSFGQLGRPPIPRAANAAGGRDDRGGGGGLLCLGGVVFLGLFIWYIILLVQVRGAVMNFCPPGVKSREPSGE